eukprot:1179762-Prorocentrum_minimum.AAC.6
MSPPLPVHPHRPNTTARPIAMCQRRCLPNDIALTPADGISRCAGGAQGGSIMQGGERERTHTSSIPPLPVQAWHGSATWTN